MKNAEPPRTPMCPGRFISAVDGIPAYAVGTASKKTIMKETEKPATRKVALCGGSGEGGR